MLATMQITNGSQLNRDSRTDIINRGGCGCCALFYPYFAWNPTFIAFISNEIEVVTAKQKKANERKKIQQKLKASRQRLKVKREKKPFRERDARASRRCRQWNKNSTTSFHLIKHRAFGAFRFPPRLRTALSATLVIHLSSHSEHESLWTGWCA